ncbi:MAG: DUF6962 family protein [Nocardioidaceae bacterium]
MLAQPAPSLSDLALAVVVLTLWAKVRGLGGVSRHWGHTFLWAGIAALAGALHHGVIARWQPVASVSWAVISVVVVISLSFLLAATVEEVLGPGRHRVFWLLRSLGLVAYLALCIAGRAGTQSILMAESVTMLCVLGLWAMALHHRHPMGRWILVAILVSAAAAGAYGIPADALARIDLDQVSAYHVAQIVGMVLMYVAVVQGSDGSGKAVPVRQGTPV